MRTLPPAISPDRPHLCGLPDMLAKAAQKGAKLQFLGSMCKDCAFRVQDDTNGYAEAVINATACLLSGDVFHCHTADYDDAGIPCKGFLYARQYFRSVDQQSEEKDSSEIS